MSANPASWKRRMAQLAKGLGKPHPPLFAPQARAIAAQIEAVSPPEFVADPTRLAKGLAELSRAAGLSALVTATASGMEAEALGARVDEGEWPARVTAPADPNCLSTEEFSAIWPRSARLDAALEATRRLAATEGEDKVILAALTGPAAFLGELLGGERAHDAEMFDFAGRALSALARAFAEAGASAIMLVETGPIGEGWRSAVGPIANVSKFHRMPLFVIAPNAGDTAPSPHGVPCCALETEAPATKSYGRVLPDTPETWAAVLPSVGGARFVTTAAEIDPALPLGAFLDAAHEARMMEQEVP